MTVRLLTVLVLVLTGLLTSLLTSSPARAADYERYVSPRPLSIPERRALRAVRTWARGHGAELAVDERLSRAAHQLLPTMASDGGVDLGTARLSAQRLGWTDGQLAALGVRAENPAAAERALLAQLETDLSRLELNRVGIAARAGDDASSLVALFSRRVVRLLPVPARVDGAATLPIAGSLAPGLDTARVTLVLGLPGGTTRTLPVPVHGRSFDARAELDHVGGVTEAQLLIDRGRGPGIAAAFPIGVSTPAFAALGSALGTHGPRTDSHSQTDTMSDGTPLDDDGAELDPARALARLVLGTRDSQALPLPAQSNLLSEVARIHATDMCDRDYFAHVSSTGADLTDRLRSHGVRFVRALENLAVAPSAPDVMRSWMESPSHRANVLDPGINAFGIGVAIRDDGQLYVVAVFVRLADDGAAEDLARDATSRLNSRRVELGRRPLATDPTLVRLATRHSREIAGVTGDLGVSPVRGPLVDTVFRELDVGEAAADVYRSDVVDPVAHSDHLDQPFARVGVGIYREPSGDGPRLWVTVIYARD